MLVKIAARQSDLARLQAFEVGRALEKASPGLRIEYSFRSSLGDQRAEDPLWKMPEKGVFTEDFVADVMSGKVDLVVHSWKDLPILDRDGTKIVATLPRADARDVLLVRRDRWNHFWRSGEVSAETSTDLPPTVFRVLTSSPRRAYNLEPFLKWAIPWPMHRGNRKVPKLEFAPVRGNIATRVKKLVSVNIDESFDALVVAKAALDRLLMSSAHGEPFVESERELRKAMRLVDFIILPLSVNPAAAAQGALAIEVRSDRSDLIELCRKIDTPSDHACVVAERKELARHGGGCHQKIGVTILNRPYGRLEFIRGLTDAGHVLDSVKIHASSAPQWPRAKQESEISPSTMKSTNRTPLNRELPQGAYYVARANAWPENAVKPATAVLWTAGLQTWRSLAQRGIWVNGTSESLGEAEDARIEVLMGLSKDEKPKWIRLTHQDSDGSDQMTTFATYRVDIVPPDLSELRPAKYFFWKSGSQFRASLEVCPEIANGYHGTGPGQTHRAVLAGLRSVGLSDETLKTHVRIFLNEDEFLNTVKSRK
jgi:hydroxymethylbilane synthase